MVPFDPSSLDFDRCEDEPLHQPEQIQGYGYLLAVDPKTYEVRVHSDNLDALLVPPPGQSLRGSSLLDALDPSSDQRDFVRATCERAQERGIRLPLELRFRPDCMVDPALLTFHAVVFVSGPYVVFEIEPAKNFTEFHQARQLANVYAMAVGPLFERMTEVSEVAAAAAELFRSLTGYERVVVLRFHEDGTGKVISESKIDEVESYLGLHYPASDIPAQAKALYLENWVRLNPDVELPTVGLTPSIQESGRSPLDLSKSVVRAMSPIHAQYVRNQGLRSSMSVSLINRGRLWGLISCHHRESHYIEQAVRIECERMGHLIGWQLHAKEEEADARERAATDAVIDALLDNLGCGTRVVDLFARSPQDVLGVMDAVGFAFCSKRIIERVGQTPDDEAIRELVRMAEQAGGDEFACHDLCGACTEVDFGVLCGALVIPLLPGQGLYTIWFRAEHTHVVRWAGDPSEKSPFASKRERLTPRASFRVHEQYMGGESRPWRTSTIETAARFNKVFLRQSLQARIELQADVDRLELREQVKNDFIATLAHELRNPLSPIAHGIELLETQSQLSEQARSDAFSVIHRQLSHLMTLVDDLLDLSRITSGKIRVEKRTLELAAVLQGALEVGSHIRERKRQTLSLHLPETPIYLDGDFTRLTQAFGNVLSNAAKYTPTDGHIDVRAHLDETQVVVAIRDNGIGLTEADIERVFEMFSQVSPYSPQAGGGLGIGLALTKSLLDLHSGSIRASSPGPDQGTEFTITLPANVEASRPASVVPPRLPVRERPRKLMVVDDNPDVADMLALIARRRGHDVLVAYSPQEALETYAGFSPEVVLLDIGLPGMDGVELKHALAQLPVKPPVFVAQTGWGQASDLERTKQAGFQFHLVKPVKTAELAHVFATLDSAD